MDVNGFLGMADLSPAGGGHLGEHFMIDAYRRSREKLPDRELAQQCRGELPERLGTRELAE
jgi:hypothetical protein